MALACSCFANSTMRSGSSVERRTISTGNWPPPGRAGGMTGNISMPGMVPSFCLHLREELESSFLALIPGLQDHAAEAAAREGELKSELRLREALEDLARRIGKGGRLLDRGVGRRVDNAEDDALVLGRRQFLGSKAREEEEHDRGDDREADPGGVNRRAHPQGGVEPAAVPIAHAIEEMVDPRGEPALRVACAEEGGGHDRRESERDHAGDGDRAGQGEGKFAEERSRQAALDADRNVNRGERDRHRDDRPDQFARAEERGVERGQAHRANVARRFRPPRWRHRPPDRPRARPREG